MSVKGKSNFLTMEIELQENIVKQLLQDEEVLRRLLDSCSEIDPIAKSYSQFTLIADDTEFYGVDGVFIRFELTSDKVYTLAEFPDIPIYQVFKYSMNLEFELTFEDTSTNFNYELNITDVELEEKLLSSAEIITEEPDEIGESDEPDELDADELDADDE